MPVIDRHQQRPPISARPDS